MLRGSFILGISSLQQLSLHLFQEQHSYALCDLKEYGENESLALKVRLSNHSTLLCSNLTYNQLSLSICVLIGYRTVRRFLKPLQESQSQMQKDITDTFQKAVKQLQVRIDCK